MGEEMLKAVEDYRNDVVEKKFPEDSTHTFAIKEEEYQAFIKRVQENTSKVWLDFSPPRLDLTSCSPSFLVQ